MPERGGTSVFPDGASQASSFGAQDSSSEQRVEYLSPEVQEQADETLGRIKTTLASLERTIDLIDTVETTSQAEQDRKEELRNSANGHIDALRTSQGLLNAGMGTLSDIRRMNQAINEADQFLDYFYRQDQIRTTEPETSDDTTERDERPELSEFELPPERESTNHDLEPVITAQEQQRIGRTLGCLAASARPSADRELNARIQQALVERERNGERPLLSDQILDRIAVQIRAGWTNEERARYSNTSSRDLVAEHVAYLLGPDGTIEARLQFDDIVRETVAKAELERRTEEIRAKITKHIEALQRKRPDSKAASWMKRLGNIAGGGAIIAGGAVGGSLLRNAIINAGIGLAGTVGGGMAAARTLSGVGGLVAGGLVGAGTGAFFAWRKAKGDIYNASNIRTQIENLKKETGKESLTAQEEAELFVQLMDKKHLRGTPEEIESELQNVLAAVENFHQKEIAAELEAALAAAENSELAKDYTHEQNLARAYEALLAAHLGGSERHKTERIDQFILDRRNEVSKKTWRGVWRGALTGALGGGILGALFPAASLVTKINVEHAVQHHTLDPLLNALRSDNVAEARHIAQGMHIDLGHNYGGQSLFEHARHVAIGVDGDNATRALHHVLSHPQETTGHLHEIIGLANHADSGRGFTEQVINGWEGGTKQPEMVGSIQDWLTKHGQRPFGTEEGWEHLLGFALISGSSAFMSRFGAAGVQNLDKQRAIEQGEIVEEKVEKKNKPKPTSEKYTIDMRMFSPEFRNGHLKDQPELQEALEKRIKDFRKRIPARHGYFMMVPDGDSFKVVRLWPYNHHRANLAQGVDVNDPEMQNNFGDVGAPDLNLIDQGTLLVREYRMDDLLHGYGNPRPDGTFSDHPQLKELEKTWDIPQWHTPNNRVSLGVDQLFINTDDQKIVKKQVFIHPLEVHKYVYAIKNGFLKPGEHVENIDQHIRLKLEERANGGGKQDDAPPPPPVVPPVDKPVADEPKPDEPAADGSADGGKDTEPDDPTKGGPSGTKDDGGNPPTGSATATETESKNVTAATVTEPPVEPVTTVTENLTPQALETNRETIKNLEQQLEGLRKELEKPAPTVQLVSDIHGNIDKFNEILSSGNPDKLFVLGDLIDRGPGSLKVLEKLKELVEQGKANFLLGNHELMFIAAMESKDNNYKKLWFNNGGKAVIQELAGSTGENFGTLAANFRNDPVLKGWAEWLKQNGRLAMLYDGHLMVHAGLPVEPSGAVAPIYNKLRGLEAIVTLENDWRAGKVPTTLLADSRAPEGQPFWIRQEFIDGIDTDEKAAVLLEYLQSDVDSKGRLPISRVVFGHTPQRSGQPLLRANGKIVGIDTDFLQNHGGQLLLDKDGIRHLSYDLKTAEANPVLSDQPRQVKDTDQGERLRLEIAELEETIERFKLLENPLTPEQQQLIVEGRALELIQEVGWDRYRLALERLKYADMIREQIKQIEQLKSTPDTEPQLAADELKAKNIEAGRRIRKELIPELTTKYAADKRLGYAVFMANDVNKLTARGHKVNTSAVPVRRVYLTVPSFNVPEIYKSILEKLIANKAMESLDLALFMESFPKNLDDPTYTQSTQNNSIILYSFGPNSDALTKAVETINAARTERPELWKLSNVDQVATIERSAKEFTVPLDQNIAFVEMPTSSSYHATIGSRLPQAISGGDVSQLDLAEIVARLDNNSPTNPGIFPQNDLPFALTRRRYMPALNFEDYMKNPEHPWRKTADALQAIGEREAYITTISGERFKVAPQYAMQAKAQPLNYVQLDNSAKMTVDMITKVELADGTKLYDREPTTT